MPFRQHTVIRHHPGGRTSTHTEMRHVSSSSRPHTAHAGGSSSGGSVLGGLVALAMCGGAATWVINHMPAPSAVGDRTGGSGEDPRPQPPADPSKHRTAGPRNPKKTSPTAKRTTAAVSRHLDVALRLDCSSATGTPTHCTVLVRNDAGSTGDFAWHATSDPAGAVFRPASGVLRRGATSSPVDVTIPAGRRCPVTLAFGTADGFVANGRVTSINGKAC
jgi:hypothetical protein